RRQPSNKRPRHPRRGLIRKVKTQISITSSSSINFYTASKASDLNDCDVARVNQRCAAPANGSRDSSAMRLKEPYLDYLSRVVCAVNSAVAGWAKSQRSAELILRGGRRISDRVLKREFRQTIVCRIVRRCIGWCRVKLPKSRRVVSNAGWIKPENRSQFKRVSRTVRRTHREQWDVEIFNLN